MTKNYLFLILLICTISASKLSAQTALQSTKHGTLISDYLEARKSEFKFVNQDVQDLIVSNSYYSENTDVTQIYVNQTFEGIEIFNAISSIAVKDGKVFYYADRFVNDISNKVNATVPRSSAVSAIQTVASKFELGSLQNLQQLEHDGNRYVFSNAGISSQDIEVKLVYVNQESRLLLAWDLIVYAKDNTHWWSVRVNAVTNEIIESNDLILSCTFEQHATDTKHTNDHSAHSMFKTSNSLLVDDASYNVFPLPLESPNHGARQLVSNPANVSASPFGWHDDDGVSGADYSITRGNNVWAKEDSSGANSISGTAPNGTTALSFDFPLDFSLSPTAYRDAAITNLFYVNNMMHDIWYQHGFDEPSGNFQMTNYSNLGADDDFVFADAQDGIGFNNANFGTPPDGFNPRMQMFLWSPPGVDTSERVIIENGSLEGIYNGVGASFGAIFTTIPVTSNLVLVTDVGTQDIHDACEMITNTAALNGNIAVLRRGLCEFGAKVLAAENAGAIAVIVVNNTGVAATVMGPGEVGDLVSIPSLMLPQNTGEALIAALLNGEAISATLLGPDITDFIDGDFDNGIIAHEYGHGISNRLAGGPSAANCLQNNEQMGEGWSDWFALMVTLKQSDVSGDARSIGTFAVSQSVNGGGIRPARYSTDIVENGFTYGASNSLSQPHGIGFVWATALWDLTWAYIDKYGFDADLFNGDGGNNKVMKLVLNGLKLQPCSPGFVDGRDAILAADRATTGGVDQCLIWDVFANRGLGINAEQGNSDSRSDQIEDFTMPESNDPSLANCSSLSVEEFSKEKLTIYPNPTQTELTIATQNNLGNVTISLVDINGRVVLKMQKELLNTIRINTRELQSGLYVLTIKGDGINYNEKIIKY